MGYETHIHGNIDISPKIPRSVVDLINTEAAVAAKSGRGHSRWQLRADQIEPAERGNPSKWVDDAVLELHWFMRQINSVHAECAFNGELHYVGSEEDDFGTIVVDGLEIEVFAGQRVWKTKDAPVFNVDVNGIGSKTTIDPIED